MAGMFTYQRKPLNRGKDGGFRTKSSKQGSTHAYWWREISVLINRSKLNSIPLIEYSTWVTNYHSTLTVRSKACWKGISAEPCIALCNVWSDHNSVLRCVLCGVIKILSCAVPLFREITALHCTVTCVEWSEPVLALCIVCSDKNAVLRSVLCKPTRALYSAMSCVDCSGLVIVLCLV